LQHLLQEKIVQFKIGLFAMVDPCYCEPLPLGGQSVGPFVRLSIGT